MESTNYIDSLNKNFQDTSTDEFVIHPISPQNGINENDSSSMLEDFSIGMDAMDLSKQSVSFDESIFSASNVNKETDLVMDSRNEEEESDLNEPSGISYLIWNNFF